jgi:hypothetical protein
VECIAGGQSNACSRLRTGYDMHGGRERCIMLHDPAPLFRAVALWPWRCTAHGRALVATVGCGGELAGRRGSRANWRHAPAGAGYALDRRTSGPAPPRGGVL